MSESKNMSSPYVVLENRSLDQWKVAELKEELKRRKLLTKGLKDDLVKRLDEAIRAEILKQADQTHDNGVNNNGQPEVPSDDAIVDPIVAEDTTTSVMDNNSAKNESLEDDNKIDDLDKNESLEKDKVTDNMDKDEILEKDNMADNLGIENKANSEVMVTDEVSNLQTGNGESKLESGSPKEEAEPNSTDIGSDGVEVSHVKSDSISIETTMSISEKNELKDNVIADDVKLEVDVKPESESVVADESHEDKVTTEEKDFNISESINIDKKNDSGDMGSPEKLNLDRSSGDDSMEEDTLESKQIDSKDVGIISEKKEVDVMVEDTPGAKNTESDPTVVSTKRKLNDQEAVANSEVAKKQRRWNSEGHKVPGQQTNSSVYTTPEGVFQASKRNSFSRSDSSASNEEPKERVVPPSSKPPTTSLRIDHFVRPFTLKAVQELLEKTGSVVSFWMDHIKTHCYVTYSSIEEAVETRNAMYNLQWPAYGGRLLIAEFVDPSEVKSRTEAPLPSPVTPVNISAPTRHQPLPAVKKPPQQQLTPPPPPAAKKPLQQQLPPPPPLPLPPPPPLPLSLPPRSREPALPPPPPLPAKIEPPILTLDDLFRKTRATPRIYYLPLSEEQVAAKVKGQGKNA